jgi:hypothetical protein
VKYNFTIPCVVLETVHYGHLQQHAVRVEIPIEAESPESAAKTVGEAIESLLRASTAPAPTPAKPTKLRAVRG